MKVDVHTLQGEVDVHVKIIYVVGNERLEQAMKVDVHTIKGKVDVHVKIYVVGNERLEQDGIPTLRVNLEGNGCVSS